VPSDPAYGSQWALPKIGWDQAYGSVREPVEGTILTVVREMGVQVASDLARVRDARLPLDATAEMQNAVISAVVERALQAGESSVRRGPDLLPAPGRMAERIPGTPY